MENLTILSSAYLPPVEYYSELINANGQILIESMEHFIKQSHRNRAVILTANGKLNLSIPVYKGSGNRTIMKEVKISNGHPWQRMHWLSIETAYRSSAYFEYYEDRLRPYYERKYEWLMDFNNDLFECLNELLKIQLSFSSTEEYKKEYPAAVSDRRSSLYSKKTAPECYQNVKSYYQVFSDRQDFIPNLSIVDLLFNCGPESKKYL